MEEHNPHDDPEQAKARKEQGDPWVMYLIVRESLGMSAGKIGAQCGHAVGMTYEKWAKLRKNLHDMQKGQVEDDSIEDTTIKLISEAAIEALRRFNAWRNESFRKVVLRADDKEWDRLKAELECFVVRDAGFTEVPAGSETVIGIWPLKKSQAPKILRKLQVLK